MATNKHEILELLRFAHFAHKVERIHSEMVGLSILWDKLHDYDDALTDGYPFGDEFGELIHKVSEWSEILRAHSVTLESMAETYAEESAE